MENFGFNQLDIMNKKRLVFIILSSLLIISACTKAEKEFDSISEVTPYENDADAMRDFSVILSQAVHNSMAVRDFIKREALDQFDNDYDVFYPFVKDKMIQDGKSFRDCLLQYTDEHLLRKIEASLPLLTVYVPDLSWIDDEAFCASRWDTVNDEVLVTYHSIERESVDLYFNGELVERLSIGDIPGGASLVVKNNERVRKKNTTKANESEYCFVSDVFDKSKNAPQTKWSWTEDIIHDPDNSDKISASRLQQIAPMAVSGYSLLKGVPNAGQRDYSYYGMTPTNVIGQLNPNVRDRIFRFRINASAFRNISDDSNDPSIGQTNFVISDNGNSNFQELTYAQLLDHIFTGGRFEFEITKYYGGASSVTYDRDIIDVSAKDLFDFIPITKTYYSATIFVWHREWHYSVSEGNLVSKWYYPSTSLRLPAWNLYNNATTVVCKIQEIDSETSTTEQQTITHKYTNGVEAKYTSSGIKFEFGLDTAYEESATHTINVTKKSGSDDMGTFTVSYMDPYIMSGTPASAPTEYTLFTYSTNRIIVSILPEVIWY